MHPPDIRSLEAGFYATTAAMTLYVATTGSDTTGDGTVGNPYATVEKAYNDIPKIIRHECKILVEAGSYSGGWPKSIDPVLYDNGRLLIIGVGSPTVVSGPHIVTGVSDLGSFTGQLITVGAGGLGATDALCGGWVRVDAGGVVGTAHKIAASTDTTIVVNKITNAVQNGDTISIIRPAITISIPDGFYIEHSPTETKYAVSTNRFSQILLHNLVLDGSSCTYRIGSFIIRGDKNCTLNPSNFSIPGPRLDFCQIILPTSQTGAMEIANCSVNSYRTVVVDGDYVTDGLTGLTNCTATVGEIPGVSITGGSGARTQRTVGLENSELFSAAILGTMMTATGRARLFVSSVGALYTSVGSRLEATSVMVEGKAASNAVSPGLYSYLSLSYVYIRKASDAIDKTKLVTLVLSNVACDPVTVTGSAVRVGVCSSVLQIGALTNFVGASGSGNKAYYFTCDTAIKSNTWLAANFASATDAKGAFITRED